MKKKLIIKGSIAGLSMSLMLLSCSLPSYPKTNIQSGSVTCTVGDETVVVEPLSKSPNSNFMRGFDASAVNDKGTGNYSDSSGNIKDIFSVLPDFGVNWVRLRVWNNPDSALNPSVPGASNKETVVNQAVRAKANGLKILLDFHYSDYWADPGKQLIPEDWLTCTTSDQLAQKVSDYTTEVLEALKEAGAEPNMIQIGNEISSGILKHKALDLDENATNADAAVRGDFAGENYFKYLSAGISAARATCPKAKIMLHFTDINRNNPASFLSDFTELDYDVVGLSWYPKWSSHGTISAMGEKVSAIIKSYNKDVVIVETSAPNTIDSDSTKNFYDSTTIANLTVNGSLYSGITASADGKVYANVQNQEAILRAVIEAAVESGASGVFSWGGEYKGSWEYGLFDGSGRPYPSLAVFKVN